MKSSSAQTTKVWPDIRKGTGETVGEIFITQPTGRDKVFTLRAESPSIFLDKSSFRLSRKIEGDSSRGYKVLGFS